MSDYRFDHQAVVPGGRVVLRAENVGGVPHELVLAALDEDFPPLDQQLRSNERRAVATIARIPARPPGGGGSFAVNLAPGRYGMICFLTDVDDVSHSVKGMSAEFRVQ